MADEKKKDQSVFATLAAIDVNEHKDNKNGFSYLSWPWAISEVMKRYPDMSYEIERDENGRMYHFDERAGYMVNTKVTIQGVTKEMWLPVMDSKNNAMLSVPYDITNKYGKKTHVNAATMFDINKAIMRCLVKNLAMFGLGFYIFAGEDLPETDDDEKTVETEPEKAEVDNELAKAHEENVKRITEEEALKLDKELTAAGIKIETVLNLYNVKSLIELPRYKYNNIRQHEDDIKARQDGKQSKVS